MEQQPLLFQVTRLPFEGAIDTEPDPFEPLESGLQPDLFGPVPQQETACACALEAGDWATAAAQLTKLLEITHDTRAASIEDALPFVRDLATRPSMSTPVLLERIAHAARSAPSNIWLRHAAKSLVRTAHALLGSARFAALVDLQAFSAVYQTMRSGADMGHETARVLLRDALLCGRAISLEALDDPPLRRLEDNERSPAWYPLLGVRHGLWPTPRSHQGADEQHRVLYDLLPTDDTGKAKRFWQIYVLWHAQREPGAVSARCRVLMRQIDRELFDEWLRV